MGEPLEIKVRKAIVGYLVAQALPALTGYRYFRGQRTGLQTLPSVCVGLRERDPLNPDVRRESAWKCRVEVCVETKAVSVNGSPEASADAHEAAVSAVEEAVFPQLVRPFVNSEGNSRPVQDFHLHSFNRPRLESYYDDKRVSFVTALVFDMIADNRDCDAPR